MYPLTYPLQTSSHPVQPRVAEGDKGMHVIPLEEHRGATGRQVASVATATSEDEMVGLNRARFIFDWTILIFNWPRPLSKMKW